MLLPTLLLAQAIAMPTHDCRHDRAALLALDQKAFDQDMTGGWRKLAAEGCEAEAADVVRDWRNAHPAVPAAQQSILFWHEGQLRADIGQTTEALMLFDRARKPPQADQLGWNLYVDGSVAFLKRDGAALEAARAKLAALPRPANLDFTGPDGKPVTIAWPMNLNVLDGFQRCWARPYKQAYSAPCSVPMRRVTLPDK